jgi:hypothetical protein
MMDDWSSIFVNVVDRILDSFILVDYSSLEPSHGFDHLELDPNDRCPDYGTSRRPCVQSVLSYGTGSLLVLLLVLCYTWYGQVSAHIVPAELVRAV